MSASSRGPIKLRLVAAATALVLAACGTTPQPSNNSQPPVQNTSYCAVADADGNGYTVVDDDMCDDDGDGHGGGGWFIFMDGHHSHSKGTRLTKSQVKNSIRWNDTAARQSAGLAPKGKVTTGQRTDSGAGLGRGTTNGSANSGSSSGTGNSGTSSGG